MCKPALRRVSELDIGVLHAAAPKILLPERLQLRIDFNGVHMVRPGGEKRGEIAAAGAHFEHAFVFLHREFLQNARLHLGLHHALALVCALVQGKFHVREGKRPVLGGDKLLAAHHV